MLSGRLSPAGRARQTARLWSEGALPACNFSLWLLLTDTSFSFRPLSFPSLRLLPPGQSAAVWNMSASPSLSLHLIAFLLIVAALRVFPSGFHPLSNHISFPVLPASFALIDSPHLQQPPTAVFFPDHSYFFSPPPSPPVFPSSSSLAANALPWSRRSPYWWQHLATVRERVSRFFGSHRTVIVALMP